LFNDFEEFELDDTYIGPDISISYPEWKLCSLKRL
jgi:hypothetical protein